MRSIEVLLLIITEQKPLDEVLADISAFEKIFIFGCGSCCTTCQTGGEKEVAEMAQKLGDKVIGTCIIGEACDLRQVRSDLSPHRNALEKADAILGMTCGSGVQTVVDYTKRNIVPALNTLGLGQVQRLGQLHEKCRECGDCFLEMTGGICPVTLCPKGLMNGPCGGQVKGKCEVGKYQHDCAWVKIYEQLKAQGHPDKFSRYIPPRNFAPSSHPRERIFDPRR